MRASLHRLVLAVSGSLFLTGPARVPAAHAGWLDQPDADLDPPKGYRKPMPDLPHLYAEYKASAEGERRERRADVEAAAQIALKRPEYRKIYRSATLCVVNEAALEAIAGGRSPKEYEAEAARLTSAFKKDGVPPMACDVKDVRWTRMCIFESPTPQWCLKNHRVDALSRAWEIETDEVGKVSAWKAKN